MSVHRTCSTQHLSTSSNGLRLPNTEKIRPSVEGTQFTVTGVCASLFSSNLQDCNTLTPVAVACIFKALDTYGPLPMEYMCRILAAAGLIQRLYAVIKQLINLGRQQQQQQQRGMVYGSALSQGAAGGAATGPKLQHLNCPLTPQGLPFSSADFFPLGNFGVAGRDAPQATAGVSDGSSDAVAKGKVLGGRKGSPAVESGLAGTDELQQQQHRRAISSVDDRSSTAAGGMGSAQASAQAGQQQQTRAEWLLERCLQLLLVLAHGDSVVKGLMCSKDNLQHLLDLTQRLREPYLLKVRVCVCVF